MASKLKNLIWSDEFNYEGKPDPTKWAYEIGGDGWGNGELQCYTDHIDNAFVSNGKLNIVAKKEKDNTYTSTRLVTKAKATFRYGRIEINAKLPIGRGTWSAFWLFGRFNGYSEIDIMEQVGYEPDRVWFSTHSSDGTNNPAAHKSSGTVIDNASFHTYTIDWTPDSIIGYVDDVQYFSLYKKDKWAFNDGMFLIMNLAVGGGWGGYEGVDANVFPQTLLIDYVRVYGTDENVNT